MPTIDIRKATISDLDDVVRVRAASGWAAYEPEMAKAHLPEEGPFWFPDGYRRTLSADDHGVFVAEQEARVTALLGIAVENDQEGRPVGHLSGIYVDPEYQRKGIATALLEFALDHFRSQGCEQAILWVRERNHGAQSFYRAVGWKPDGKTKDVKNATDITGGTALRFAIAL